MSRTEAKVTIIGGGLAGCEAAWQVASRGIRVRLFEMRPERPTAAHCGGELAELVCSNSFKSLELGSAHGLIKAEMRRLGSLILDAAERAAVPAGAALAVDRALFARSVTGRIEEHPLIEVVRREQPALPRDGVAIVAAGPLCSERLSADLAQFFGEENLAFFDAISPIVEAESIDWEIAFRASRYGKGEGADYANCPMTREEYERFRAALLVAEPAPLHDFDRKLLFEGCLPVEELAARGVDTMRFGPLKPVGLIDPRNGARPWAVVQLRQDDLAASHWSMVGFQNRLRFDEQKRVFRMIPGLERASFVKLGMMHRNTFINAPRLLRETFQTRQRPELFIAGQLSGVEGYTESSASGLLAGIGAARVCAGAEPPLLPEETALGSVQRYIARSDAASYQPTNVSFGLLPPLVGRRLPRRERKRALSERALAALTAYLSGGPLEQPGQAAGAG